MNAFKKGRTFCEKDDSNEERETNARRISFVQKMLQIYRYFD